MTPRPLFTSALLIGLTLIALTGCEPKQRELRPVQYHQAELSRIHSIAIVPFADAPGNDTAGSGKAVVAEIANQLYRCRGVKVIERSRVAEIMNERDFQISQMDTDQAAQIGKIAQADAVLFGSLTQYEAQQEYSHGGVGMISGGGTKTKHRVGLNVRLVDVSNGEVIYAESGGAESRDGYSECLKEATEEAIQPLRDYYEVSRGSKK
jgi:curli biogenesis system outer membrane secretion channel CsgG